MKKYSAIFFMLLLFFAALNINAGEKSDSVFKSLKCSMCHKPDTGSSFPSLKEISSVYKGDEEKLISYLEGKSEPIVKKKSKTMDRYIEKTKDLSAEEMKMLAGFILDK